ncbi:MAG: hypothetical protein CM15mV26_0170 [uncultured marine virus]|nr:MAG: hypothetical protein CM15mV26_0170 [uncultured marine virus]
MVCIIPAFTILLIVIPQQIFLCEFDCRTFLWFRGQKNQHYPLNHLLVFCRVCWFYFFRIKPFSNCSAFIKPSSLETFFKIGMIGNSIPLKLHHLSVLGTLFFFPFFFPCGKFWGWSTGAQTKLINLTPALYPLPGGPFVVPNQPVPLTRMLFGETPFIPIQVLELIL